MKKTWVTVVLLALATNASAIELRLKETLGTGILLGERNADLLTSGVYADNSVVFDFTDRWSLQVNYFGTAGVGVNEANMRAEALAIEEGYLTDAVNSQDNIGPAFDGTGLLADEDFEDPNRFLTFSSRAFWAGMSVLYRGGDPDGIGYSAGLGGSYVSMPRVGYDYQLTRKVTYTDDEGEDAEYTYKSSLANNTESVTERSAPALRASFSLNWAVGDILSVHGSVAHLGTFGAAEPISIVTIGAGASLLLP